MRSSGWFQIVGTALDLPAYSSSDVLASQDRKMNLSRKIHLSMIRACAGRKPFVSNAASPRCWPKESKNNVRGDNTTPPRLAVAPQHGDSHRFVLQFTGAIASPVSVPAFTTSEPGLRKGPAPFAPACARAPNRRCRPLLLLAR